MLTKVGMVGAIGQGGNGGRSGLSFPYVVNAKLGNTVKTRQIIGEAKAGSARRKMSVFMDSRGQAAGVVGNDGTGSPGSRRALSPVKLLADLINGSLCPAVCNAIAGQGSIGATGSALYDTGVNLGGSWGVAAIDTLAGGGFTIGISGLNLTITRPNFNRVTTLVLNPTAGSDILVRQGGNTVLTIAKDATAVNTPRVDTAVMSFGTTTQVSFRDGGSSSIFIPGIDTYMDTETALSVVPAVWGGKTYSDFNLTTNPWSSKNVLPLYGFSVGMTMLGINSIPKGETLPQVQAACDAWVAAQIAAGIEPILIVEPFANPATYDPVFVAGCRTALYAVAAIYDIPVIDLQIAFGSWAAQNALGIMADAVHMNDYSLVALYIFNALRQIMAL